MLLITLTLLIIFIVCAFNFKPQLKFLHLVLYSNDTNYDCIYKITSKYYKKFNNVKTIYYTYSSDIQNNYSLIGDMLYIKGKESYLPGILEKTIKAFEYNFNYDYDYIVRSNISTIVNFDLLNKELIKKPIDYGAGRILNLQWIDEKCGVIDKTYFGTNYASGTSIIISKNAINLLNLNKNLINYNLIDDLSIGVLFKELNIIPQEIGSILDVKEYTDKKYTFYRNKNIDRSLDCKHINYIINKNKW